MTHPVVISWLRRAQHHADGATAGPWVADLDGIVSLGAGSTSTAGELIPEAIVITDSGAYPPHEPDAEFICAARADVPRLLEAVRSVLDIADELSVPPANGTALLTATRLHDAVYTALFPAPEATRDRP